MIETFDPYQQWLGIPPDDQPADYYRLLGIAPFEDDAEAISSAADRRMGHVRTFQTGPRSEYSQQLLNELASAKVCLLNRDTKISYDAVLRGRQSASRPAAQTEIDWSSLADNVIEHANGAAAGNGAAAPPANDIGARLAALDSRTPAGGLNVADIAATMSAADAGKEGEAPLPWFLSLQYHETDLPQIDTTSEVIRRIQRVSSPIYNRRWFPWVSVSGSLFLLFCLYTVWSDVWTYKKEIEAVKTDELKDEKEKKEADEPRPAAKQIVVRQEATGQIHLPAAVATLHGKSLAIEQQGMNAMVTSWNDADDWVSWEFEIIQPGYFRIAVSYELTGEEPQGEYEVKVGTESRSRDIRAPIEGETVVTDEFVLAVRRPGRHQLSIRPEQMPSTGLMKLRQVTLIPVNGPGGDSQASRGR